MRMFKRVLCAVAAALLAVPLGAQDSRDIDATARSVVRVIVITTDSEGGSGVGMGSGVAITPNRILTNAHVVAGAVEGEGEGGGNGFVGIVPSEGRKRYEGRVIAYRPDIDLAVIDIGNGRITPATLFSGTIGDGAGVAALGYPYGVDRALARGIEDVIAPQSPLKAPGNVVGRRSNKQFDTVVHDANIGRGSSGGPLVDGCGRVVGINSFLSVSDGIDSPFAFAISVREIVPFLQRAGVTPSMIATPCLSSGEADARAAALAKADELEAARLAGKETESAAKVAAEKQTIRDEIATERENGIAIAALLLVLGGLILAGGGFAFATKRQRIAIGAGIGGATLILGSVLVYLARPRMNDAEDRYAARHPAAKVEPEISETSSEGPNICTLVPERSLVKFSKTDDVPLDWQEGGCVNKRTQYGNDAGVWSRAFVPNEEATVTVQRFDPAKGRYTVERYLMSADAMDAARKVRARYTGKSCATDPAARRAVSDMEAAIRQTLPPTPNEKLVFDCHKGTKN